MSRVPRTRPPRRYQLHDGISANTSSSARAVRWALGVLVTGALLFALWLALTLTADAPAALHRHRRPLQIRIDRQRTGRVAAAPRRRRAAAVLGVPRAADDLPRSPAGRLRRLRLDHRAGSRAAGRRLAPPPHRHRSRRPQLRAVPQRHRARDAHVAAARRARHAGPSARSPGLRAVRARMHARFSASPPSPCAPRSHARAAPTRSSACCCAPD